MYHVAGAFDWTLRLLRQTASTISATQGRQSPNPYGKLGGPEHRRGVDKLTSMIRRQGLVPRQEFRVNTPGGMKSYRFVDVVALDKKGNPVNFYQVGRITQRNIPIARERYAISDLFEFGDYDVPITFVPYWK